MNRAGPAASSILLARAKGDCIFAATGVTDGSLLRGVHQHRHTVTAKHSKWTN